MRNKKYISHMHLFNYQEQLFAYDYIKNILVKVDFETYKILKNFSEVDFSEQTINDIKNMSQVELFRQLGILFYSEDFIEEKSFKSSAKTAYISFPTAHRCNLRCEYCFARHGTNYDGKTPILSKALVKDILEFVYLDYFADYSNIRLDFVSGGEPLLNFELIKDTVEISDLLYKKTEKPLEIFLCTNGTINEPSIWQFINEHNINLGISLDGPQNIHDMARVFESGAGSYFKTRETINYIINSTNLSPHTKSIWILSVITSKTTSLLDILKHNKSLGIRNMQMKLARLDKDNIFAITDELVDGILKNYEELTEYFAEAAKKHDYSDLYMILNENDYYGKLIYHIIYEGRIKRCYAGDRKLSFDGNGNIYPCDSFVGNDEFILGNIYSGVNEEAQEKFVQGTIFERNKCSSCWAKYICAGDCYYNSYLVNKDIYEPDSTFCKINCRLIEYALYLVHVIKSNGDLAKLKKVIRIRRRYNT